MDKQKYYISLCLFCRNENIYIKEWVDYHTKIGVEHFYIYDNWSKVPLINELRGYENITFINWPWTNNQVWDQCKAYMDCIEKYYPDNRWIGFIDTDEFIVLNEKNNIKDFLQEYEEFSGVSINWQLFGSNNLKQRPESVIKSFTKKAKVDFERNTHVKTIVNPKYVCDCYTPHYFYYTTGFAVNENKEVVFNSFNTPVTVQKAQINHYWCKSLEEFSIKAQNRVNVKNQSDFKMEMFYEFNQEANLITDVRIIELSGFDSKDFS